MRKFLAVFTIFAVLIFVISCGEGNNNPKNEEGSNSENSSEDDDSYAETEPTDPKEIRVSKCTGLPEHAQWNTVSEIKQSWDGRSWQPPKEGSYNETPSETECRFECVADCHWDGSACVQCKTGYVWDGSDCVLDCDPDSVTTLPECSESSGAPCKDSSTGLIWSSEWTSFSLHGAIAFCSGLGGQGGVCGGWHLPTISELRTLIIRCEGSMSEGSCAVKDPDCLSEEKCWSDDCYCEGTGNGFFSKLGDSGSYWSKSRCDGSAAWGVNFFNAGVLCLEEDDDANNDNVIGSGETEYHDIRCVRGEGILGCAMSTTCKDPSTGLIWSARASEKYTWQDAVDYCTSLNSSNYGGFSNGWHLPTITELRTLIVNCPSSMPTGSCAVKDPSCLYASCIGFEPCDSCSPNYSGEYSKFTESYTFWSSSTVSDRRDNAWHVGFVNGYVSYSSKGSTYSVRCVR